MRERAGGSWHARALVGLLVTVVAGSAGAQALGPARTGPIIADYGPVYEVESPEFATPLDAEYRLVFDVKTAPDDTTLVNPAIGTLARFLNMHARAGVPLEQMHLALVLHGSAGKDALDHTAFRDRYGHDTPNRDLLVQLAAANVEIILCGQTAMHRGLPPAQLADPVRLALSAMTALATLQQQGYTLIAF